MPDLPAMLLTYDFYDLAEAVRGARARRRRADHGTLPIALPGMFDAGWGIVR